MLESESSLGLLFATNLFVGKEENSPDDCVTIFDTYGRSPLLELEGNSGYEYRAVQIRVRNNSYVAGWNLMQQIYDLLHGKNHEVWNNSEYQIIYVSSGPALLDWDENDRVRFVLNLEIQRKEV